MLGDGYGDVAMASDRFSDIHFPVAGGIDGLETDESKTGIWNSKSFFSR